MAWRALFYPARGYTIRTPEPDAHKASIGNAARDGRIWFDHVRIPRGNLLDRYATVSEAGEYHSDIESTTKRFFSMLGTLIQGRVSVCGAAINASRWR